MLELFNEVDDGMRTKSEYVAGVIACTIKNVGPLTRRESIVFTRLSVRS